MKYFLPHSKLQSLLDLISSQGYEIHGPQAKNGSINYEHLQSSNQLPWKLRDYQKAGSYTLGSIDENKCFAWSSSISSIKPFLFKSEETTWQVIKDESGRLKFIESIDSKPIAMFGVRPCDVNAMLIQDKVFLQGEYIDPQYKAQREKMFIVVANCTYATENCFCIAAGFSNQAKTGFDISITEIDNGFIITASNKTASTMLIDLELNKATLEQINQTEQLLNQAANTQTKTIPNVKERQDNMKNCLSSNQWGEFMQKCTSCGTCTQVCPTCFCHKVMEIPSFDGDSCEHIRSWDSCFQEEHGQMHGHNVRPDMPSRYKQWLKHKFVDWQKQYDTSGCVGCGKCITWCPVAIDVTEGVNILHQEGINHDK